jgi:hypothetical protein
MIVMWFAWVLRKLSEIRPEKKKHTCVLSTDMFDLSTLPSEVMKFSVRASHEMARLILAPGMGN